MVRYKYFSDNKRKVIAVSTFAGKTVRGVALCSPEDDFDIEKGKNIAAARCAAKIAQKRWQRAVKRDNEAYNAWASASAYLTKTCKYEIDARKAFEQAYDQLITILNET